MKNKRIVIDVVNPCAEDWEKMAAHGGNKMCAQCCKQVHDFTAMSDAEILNMLVANSGKICGRFASHQVGRELRGTPTSSGLLARAGLLSSLLVTGAASSIFAQQTNQVQVVRNDAELSQRQTPQNESSTNILHGRILDGQDNTPLAYAEIYVQKMPNPVVADEDGNFSCVIPESLMSEVAIRFEVSAIGYGMQNFTVSPKELTAGQQIYLMEARLMGDIAVTVVKRRWWQFWKWRF